METSRGQKAETMQDRIEVNKLDIHPAAGNAARGCRKRDGLKARQGDPGGRKKGMQNRPKGHRQTRRDQ